MNALEQLRRLTVVVADTGDFNLLARYRPQDATTNPSLVLKAAQKPEYRPLVERVVAESGNTPVDRIVDRLLVAFGIEILRIVPGRVSTEVDARLSFDTRATVAKAHDLIAQYEALGVARERVLIKIASTWEGIAAARQLQREGIRCNMTLLFSLTQALACADAGAQLISPFVGRITDWYKKRDGRDVTPDDDPGVQSVRRIHAAYRRLGARTEVMGASFRSPAQVLALAGCDLLTISPDLLEALQTLEGITVASGIDRAATDAIDTTPPDEATFRWQLNEDAMATEKLAEGIRVFAADARTLETLIAQVASR